MAQLIARRPVLYWILTVLAGVVVGALIVGQADAAPGPPGGLNVEEQNVDGDGNIKVHEQGVVPVTDNNGSLSVDDSGGVLSVDDAGSSLTVDDSAGALSVDDGDASLSVDDGGTTFSVDDGGSTLTVDGIVNIGNLPESLALFSFSGEFNIEIGVDTNPQTLSVPSTVRLTDVIARFDGQNGGDCRFAIVKDGVLLFSGSGYDDENLFINLTTGISGPLELVYGAAGTPGQRCLGSVAWTGTSTS